MIAVVVTVGVIAMIWFISGSDIAHHEIVVRLSLIAVILLVFPFVYSWQFLTAPAKIDILTRKGDKMNDALTKDTHEPKTPGDDFVEFRRQEKLIWALEKKVTHLEGALAKQRAVNEALANYIAGGSQQLANSLGDALREALKATP